MSSSNITYNSPLDIVFAEMKKRGWIINSNTKFGEQVVKDGKVNVEVVSEYYFSKHGKIQPETVWKSEMKEVCRELGLAE